EVVLQAGKANGFSTREDISKQHTLVGSEVLPGLTAFEHVKRIVLVVENQSLVDRFLNLHVAAHREIHDSAGDITRVNGVIDQGTGFCGRSEERRVGKECRSRRGRDAYKRSGVGKRERVD